jgi:hypothetical protein
VHHVAAEQLGSTTGDGIHIQAEQLGHLLIAAMTPFQAFQPGVESPLLFVQEAVEEDNGRLQSILGPLLRLPRSPLLLTPLALRRTV